MALAAPFVRFTIARNAPAEEPGSDLWVNPAQVAAVHESLHEPGTCTLILGAFAYVVEGDARAALRMLICD